MILMVSLSRKSLHGGCFLLDRARLEHGCGSSVKTVRLSGLGHCADVGFAVSVKDIDAPGALNGTEYEASKPVAGSMSIGVSLVAANDGDEVLPAFALYLLARRHHTQPRAIVGDDYIRLIAVTFVGNDRAVFDVARIARLMEAG